MLKLALQVIPQVIPEGLLATAPAPVPMLTTDNIAVGMSVKVAVTAVLASSVTVQAPVPGQLTPVPLQPAKSEPLLGVAFKVTWAPPAKLALQVAPQLIPEGLLVTVPVPVPAGITDSMALAGISVKAAVTTVSADSVS